MAAPVSGPTASLPEAGSRLKRCAAAHRSSSSGGSRGNAGAVTGHESRPIPLVNLCLALGLTVAHLSSRQPVDAPYVPTPPAVVDAMLRLARVGPGDVVYDLGSGDGRIVIAAARDFGARAVGIERNPRLVREAEALAREAGVSDRVRFIEADLFKVDVGEATVVTLYLLPTVNLKVRDKLRKELRAGTRVVSHAYAMGDWLPDLEMAVEGRAVFLWQMR